MASSVVIIGGSRTFSALFLNASGLPNDVVDPTISIISYSGAGSTFLADHLAMQKANPPETGQYVFVWNVPDDTVLTEDQNLYVRFEGTDPTTGNLLTQEELVRVVDPNTPGAGIFATFVKGG